MRRQQCRNDQCGYGQPYGWLDTTYETCPECGTRLQESQTKSEPDGRTVLLAFLQFCGLPFLALEWYRVSRVATYTMQQYLQLKIAAKPTSPLDKILDEFDTLD